MDIDVDRWKFVSETNNGRNYEVERGILAIVPRAGVIDTAADAQEAVDVQHEYFRSVGGGVAIIFFSELKSLDKDARRVYQEAPIPSIFRAAALVGGSLLARAIASFFLGVAKPRIPTRFFGSFEEALEWAQSINKEAVGQ